MYPQNIGTSLSIDETSLSNGELYTILTNKAGKGKKGSLIAMIKGTESEKVISILKEIPKESRDEVKEITLDMAGSMNLIVKKCFGQALPVIDRFHVQKLAYDALQKMRIEHRWNALDLESKSIIEAREKGEKYDPTVYKNGDTLKQLLARSRYVLFKKSSKWTQSQTLRAEILFNEYPDLKKGHELAMGLGEIYDKNKDKGVAYTKLAQWYNEVDIAKFDSFQTVLNTISAHYINILNFFENRSTNASAESFNAKIKEFRRTSRGVRDLKFFLFRLKNIFV